MAGEILTVRKNLSPVLQDGSQSFPVGDAYGTLVVEDDVARWKRDGRVFFYNRGNTTTEVTFTNTAILYTRPSQVVRVPLGTTIIPIHLACYFQTAAGVINEGVWISCNNDVGAGTSTAVTAGTGRGNLRANKATDAGACLVHITYSGDVTTTGTGVLEFARWVQPFADAAGVPETWIVDRKTSSNMPILVGPASLILIVGGGTALTGFTTTMWAEFNSADLGF